MCSISQSMQFSNDGIVLWDVFQNCMASYPQISRNLLAVRDRFITIRSFWKWIVAPQGCRQNDVIILTPYPAPLRHCKISRWYILSLIELTLCRTAESFFMVKLHKIMYVTFLYYQRTTSFIVTVIGAFYIFIMGTVGVSLLLPYYWKNIHVIFL